MYIYIYVIYYIYICYVYICYIYNIRIDVKLYIYICFIYIYIYVLYVYIYMYVIYIYIYMLLYIYVIIYIYIVRKWINMVLCVNMCWSTSNLEVAYFQTHLANAKCMEGSTLIWDIGNYVSCEFNVYVTCGPLLLECTVCSCLF